MKNVNLEEILLTELKATRWELATKHGISTFALLRAVKEACRQTLELAAENVCFKETTSHELNAEDYNPFLTADDNTIWTFDKQSILDTINQIE